MRCEKRGIPAPIVLNGMTVNPPVYVPLSTAEDQVFILPLILPKITGNLFTPEGGSKRESEGSVLGSRYSERRNRKDEC